MRQSVETKADAKKAFRKVRAKKYSVTSGIAGRLLALVLAAAMVVTSSDWSVLAEENSAAVDTGNLSEERILGDSTDGSGEIAEAASTELLSRSGEFEEVASASLLSSSSDVSSYTYSLDGTISNNVSDNNYSVYYASTVKSYLMENEDGSYTRVEYISGTGVVVETYSSDYVLTESVTLEAELSIFGAFYAGENYNFLVFGQTNTEESDECEVIRVVKYDKSWNRISQCSIYGANTYIPFDAGSARMTEVAGSLYLYTCHEMYLSSDGYHHQANMTFVITEESMEVSQSYYKVMNISYGYVSHSFNQFIQTDGTYVYRVDHGDAHPRAVSLTCCLAGGSITNVAYTYILSICGETGANATGVSVGGFELSTDNCLIAGNSVDQSDEDTYSAYGQRNIFLAVMDKSAGTTDMVWLTDYTSEDGITPRTPQLVKLSDDAFLMMWEEYNSSRSSVTVKAVTVDGDGKLTSDIVTMQARLSDCQPIMASDGLVKWYVTDGSAATMYAIDPDHLFSYTYLNPSVENAASGVQVSWTTSGGVVSYDVYRKAADGEYALVKSLTDTSWLDTGVESGTTYTYQICAKSSAGEQAWSEELVISYLSVPVISDVSNEDTSIQVTWDTVSGAASYYIYYKKSTASYYNYGVLEAVEGDVQTCYLNSATTNTTYEFYVIAYLNGNYSVASDVVSHLFLKAPTVSLSTDAGGNQLSWSSITGAESYTVYRKTADSEYAVIGTTTDLAWTDADIVDGVTYTYQVYAFADGTYSGGSTEKSGGRTLISDCTITLGTTSYTYNGSAKEPSVTVTNGSTRLTKGTHYTVTYSNNVNAGTATVTVTGIGAYAGTAAVTFTISKATQTVTASISSSTITEGDTATITTSGTGTITYTSSDTSVATVSSSGVVTGVSAGSATITVKAAGNDNYEEKTKTLNVTVKAQQSSDSGSSSSGGSSSGDSGSSSSGGSSSGNSSSSGSDSSSSGASGTSGSDSSATSRKSISSCQMVFSKVGDITYSTLEKYLILVDGTTILEEYEDYIIWGMSYSYGSNGVVSTVTVSVMGYGDYTGEATFTLTPITAKTVLKSATKTSSGVKLTWQKETGAAGYQIYRKTGSGSYSLVKTITKNSTTSWTDTSVADYKQYTYYVRAYTVNSSGKVYATKSSTKTVSTYLTTPSIKSASNTSTGVKLSWSAVSGAAKYQIWRKTSSGSWTKLGTTTSTSYTDKTAKSGTTYSYRLRCVKSNGTTATSLYSASKSIRRLSAGKVSSLTNTSGGITVKWSKVTGASGYYIYRKAGSGSYKKIATVSGGSTVSYTNKTTGTYKVANGTTYTYYVIPYYKSGSTVTKGTYSTTKKTVRMTAVSLSSVKNSSSKKMTVKWAKNSKATGYQIQYSTSSSFASGSKTKTVTVSGASTVSRTIGSLTKSKKYYVRIRTYKTVSGTKYFSAWSSKKSVTISK